MFRWSSWTLLPFIENKQLSRKLCFENKQMEEHEFSMTLKKARALKNKQIRERNAEQS